MLKISKRKLRALISNIMQGLDAIDDNILCFPSMKCEVIAT